MINICKLIINLNTTIVGGGSGPFKPFNSNISMIQNSENLINLSSTYMVLVIIFLVGLLMILTGFLIKRFRRNLETSLDKIYRCTSIF